ncbi:MAG: hypothetical protein WC441_04430 [Patescibacteria group bacterium]
MEVAAEISKAVYETVVTRERTVVFIPKNVEVINEHTYGDPPYKVPRHYHRGIATFGVNEAGVPIYVNVHYFGFNVKHLGKNVSATVSVKIKSKAGKKYVIIDVNRDQKKENDRGQWLLKIGVDTEGVTSDNIEETAPVVIPGTDKCVMFKRIK